MCEYISYKAKQVTWAGLILERAREPGALYFALGLSCFASAEPGRLSLIGMGSKRFSELFEKLSSFESFLGSSSEGWELGLLAGIWTLRLRF